MSPEKLNELIEQGEGIDVEFKSAQKGVPENLYETVCAFLNRNGGHIILGVDDHKNIIGIEPTKIQNYINQIVVTVNNPQKLNPTFFLSPENIEILGKQLIYIFVPESSQVHSTSGKIFDRNYDGDFQKDFLTGQEGFTLAAALLLGKDSVIQSIVPAYKTDAILRVQNLDRYDDRDDVRTNLIESYDRLMAFVQKHLPDKFYEEPDAQRRSLRAVIFHEVIINLLGHREFTNPFPAKLIIEANKVRTENWCKPHGFGVIDPSNFTPQTKNPTIAKFFREIGRFEELGSGVRNIFKYTKFYSNGLQPILVEGDIFKLTIPIAEMQHYDVEGLDEENGGLNGGLNEENGGLNGGLNEENGGLNGGLKSVLEIVQSNPGQQAKNISILLNNRSLSTIEKQIRTLVRMGIIERIGSKKTGGYHLTNR
jgi:predicted HTH transcriptional regulator